MPFADASDKFIFEVNQIQPADTTTLIFRDVQIPVVVALTHGGKPFANRQVSTGLKYLQPSKGGPWSVGRNYHTDDEGKLTLETPPDSYELSVHSREADLSGEMILEADRGSTAERTLELSPPNTQQLALTILNQDGAHFVAGSPSVVGEGINASTEQTEVPGTWKINLFDRASAPVVVQVMVLRAASKEVYRKCYGTFEVEIPAWNEAADPPSRPIERTVRLQTPGELRFTVATGDAERIAVNLQSADPKFEWANQNELLPLDKGRAVWSGIPPGDYWLTISNNMNYCRSLPTAGTSRLLIEPLGTRTLVSPPDSDLAVTPAQVSVVRVEIAPGQVADLGEIKLLPLGVLRGLLPEMSRQSDPALAWLDWEDGAWRSIGWGFLPEVAYASRIRLTRTDGQWPYFEVPVYFDGSVYARVPVGDYAAELEPGNAAKPRRSLGKLTITSDSETMLAL
jgi:hypothetical protein